MHHLYDTTELHKIRLKSLSVKGMSYEVMLSFMFLTKLSPDIRLIISRKVLPSDAVAMEILLKLLEDSITGAGGSPSLAHSLPC